MMCSKFKVESVLNFVELMTVHMIGEASNHLTTVAGCCEWKVLIYIGLAEKTIGAECLE